MVFSTLLKNNDLFIPRALQWISARTSLTNANSSETSRCEALLLHKHGHEKSHCSIKIISFPSAFPDPGGDQCKGPHILLLRNPLFIAFLRWHVCEEPALPLAADGLGSATFREISQALSAWRVQLHPVAG